MKLKNDECVLYYHCFRIRRLCISFKTKTISVLIFYEKYFPPFCDRLMEYIENAYIYLTK